MRRLLRPCPDNAALSRLLTQGRRTEGGFILTNVCGHTRLIQISLAKHVDDHGAF